jgi:hypothetical protein
MGQPKFELTDPLDHEIARRVKNALASFEPPPNHQKWFHFVTRFIGISPILYSVSTLVAPRDVENFMFVTYPTNHWDEALCFGPLSRGMVLAPYHP